MTEVTEKQAEMLNALSNIGPMSNYELQLQLNWPKRMVHNMTQKLKQKKMIRVVRYEFDGSCAGHAVQVYAEGEGEDAKRPTEPVKVNETFNAMLAAKAHRKLGVWAGLMR